MHMAHPYGGFRARNYSRTQASIACSQCTLRRCTTMAPHLTNHELDQVTVCVAKGMGAKEILAVIAKQRRRAKVDPPKIWALRRAVAGATHKRGKTERRGRGKKLTAVQTSRLLGKRRDLIEKAQGERYVSLDEVVPRSRVPKVHRTTAARYLRTVGVKWCRMREKPPRTVCHEEDRKEVCRTWRKRPTTFWTETVDLIIDAKKYPLPGNDANARRLRQQKVRGVLRTRQEGLTSGFTRPSLVKHKFNAGGHVHILAGICGERVVMWEEIGGKWCGQRAADMYAGPVKDTLQRHRPGKRTWLIMEDGDPSGFKSGKGKAAKRANRMNTCDQPPYSPDLNPLDFCIWAEIEKRALATRSAAETKTQYQKRLRKVALHMPRSLVRKAVEGIKQRAQDIFDADGKNIPRD